LKADWLRHQKLLQLVATFKGQRYFMKISPLHIRYVRDFDLLESIAEYMDQVISRIIIELF